MLQKIIKNSEGGFLVKKFLFLNFMLNNIFIKYQYSTINTLQRLKVKNMNEHKTITTIPKQMVYRISIW